MSACGGSSDAGASPTETRAATASAAATMPTEGARSYTEQALALLTELAAASESVAAVMEEADIESSSWREAATSRLETLRGLHSQAIALDPDAQVEPVHEHLVAATRGSESAARLLDEAIHSRNIDKASEAAAALGEAVYALAEARALLEELQRG